ncbi:MAG: thioredoxin TrxA [Rickettsiales bacterium]|nr:thioredoxin TrxA [Alphaproteobacteria bacterium]
MTSKHISDSEFDATVAAGSQPVLVDFWAEWCGPCKQLSPVLDELANEYAGKLTVAKVNIDQNPDSPQKYGVRGIPTLIVFKEGKPVATKVGSLPKSQLVEWLNGVLAA